MSNSLQSVTLQTAVLLQVKEFAAATRQFSVHDITREIRNKVNSGSLEIPEVEVAGGTIRFDIPHVKVKALFDELWQSGVFSPEFSLNRHFNGVYYEYTPNPTSATVTSPAPATSFSVAQTPIVAAPTIPAPTAVANGQSVSKAVVVERIKQYLTNCAGRSFRPSLKQVQSAIKRGDASTGWSCDDLSNIIENDLGFNVVADPDTVSASQVIV